MAAKTLQEALFAAFEKRKHIVDMVLMETLKSELRDYAAHRAMLLGDGATAKELFNELFTGIPVEPKKEDK